MRSQLVQSTGDEAIQYCLVYDKRTGEVLHIHQFVAQESKGSFSREKRAELAVATAALHHEKGFLEVYHLQEDLELLPDKNYRIDLSSKTLLVEKFDIRELLRKGSGEEKK